MPSPPSPRPWPTARPLPTPISGRPGDRLATCSLFTYWRSYRRRARTPQGGPKISRCRALPNADTCIARIHQSMITQDIAIMSIDREFLISFEHRNVVRIFLTSFASILLGVLVFIFLMDDLSNDSISFFSYAYYIFLMYCGIHCVLGGLMAIIIDWRAYHRKDSIILHANECGIRSPAYYPAFGLIRWRDVREIKLWGPPQCRNLEIYVHGRKPSKIRRWFFYRSQKNCLVFPGFLINSEAALNRLICISHNEHR